MKQTATAQFYSYLREAMFANKLTAAAMSALKGVHYTYIYNSIRKNANVTLATASTLAEAAGYDLVISFEPKAATSPALAGTMDPLGPIYTERRTKAKVASDNAAKLAPPAPSSTAIDAEAELDAEIAALMADAP